MNTIKNNKKVIGFCALILLFIIALAVIIINISGNSDAAEDLQTAVNTEETTENSIFETTPVSLITPNEVTTTSESVTETNISTAEMEVKTVIEKAMAELRLWMLRVTAKNTKADGKNF